jgi:ZIP family zinc transporter
MLGAVLDGIPESAVIGISLLEGGTVGVPVLAAVFLSNLPESLSSSTGMRKAGSSSRHVIGIWCVVVLVSGLSAALGYGLLDGASGNTVGLIQAFAAGAVLTMLADTMMPQAFQDGGRAVGLLTVLGFALAYLLSTIE